MLRQIFMLIGAAALAAPLGCRTEAEVRNPFGGDERDRASLAAYAASAEYPSDAEASDERNVAAMVDRRTNTIKIVNFSDQPIHDANIWINGSYVNRVRTIPPNGTVTLNRNQFYDSRGASLASVQTAVDRVEIVQGDRLQRAQGPVFE